jgi:hypothetical protein
MISIVYNEIQRAVEMYLDLKGVDLLIKKLEELKLDGDHIHLYATNDDQGLSVNSPYKEDVRYNELILDLLPSDAWGEE